MTGIEDSILDVLKAVKPQQVRAYALAKGWNRVAGVNGEIALFNHPKGQFDQLIVPMDHTLDDYSKRLRDVVQNLSEFESRPAAEVIGDLLAPDSDILRYRVLSPATAKGSIPLEAGINLLEGAKRSLLASACTVINPLSHHPRMSRTEAKQLLSACHLGQTERRSFGISLYCPLRAVEQDQPPLPNTDPFTRRAVETLIKSLSQLVESIELDDIGSVIESKGPPSISANLCDAILLMQPPDDESQLIISASWAVALPPSTTLPKEVRVKQEHFPQIEELSKKLRPKEAPAAAFFAGYVENIGGDLDTEGLMSGEAILSVLHDGEMLNARAALSGADWQTAYEALGVHGIVLFNGVFHRGTRNHRFTNVSGVKRVEPT